MTKPKEDYEFVGSGLLGEEIKWGRKRFKDYCAHYPKIGFADYSLLEELVIREAFQERYKKKLEDIQRDINAGTMEEKEKTPVPSYYLDLLNENLDQIIKLRSKLGLKDASEVQNYIDYVQVVNKKFAIWEEKHIDERIAPCAFCGELNVYHMRMTNYEPCTVHFFKGKILFNEHLWKCYKDGKITKEDLSLIWGTSLDYIDWIEKKVANR